VYTLVNPLLIIVFTGVFASLGLGWQPGRNLDVVKLIGGVFLGSTLWWLTLTMLAGAFRRRLDDGTLRWINVVAGGLIVAIGIWQISLPLRAGLF
jgi:threonine/homoserine/homoserine lactone efflux protein